MSSDTISLQAFDNTFWNDHKIIVGVDEAGRGPLAGPVTAAAVTFYPDAFHELIRDSKKLSEKQREAAYEWIIEHAQAWSVHSLGVQAINKVNILQAALTAMERAVAKLNMSDVYVLVDGNRVPFELRGKGQAIVGGDRKSFCIAAASILAKVSRDRMMKRWAEIYPEYGFEKHKGYGTAQHIKALEEYYPTPIHRRYFAPIKTMQFPRYPKPAFLGRWGENWAIYYLILKGYKYITRNYHGGNKGEIDIIMKNGELFIMVEVKASLEKDEFQAAERINEEKIQKMILASERYFYDLNMDEYDVRFDAVTISGNDWHAPNIEHYKNILY
ncbi:MAG: ribonuclease HII [Candidatus Neomarinimicrobiota bacterium]|nr:MAG: ribonuclease HII [Candidatus Neomarinimicrobiota bacterium]